MNEALLSALLLTRELLGAAEAVADGSPAGSMTAVVIADLAVETASKALRASDPSPRAAKKPSRDPTFWQVLDDLESCVRARDGDERASLRHRDDATRLHEVRNSVQHRGVEPPAREVALALGNAPLIINAWLADLGHPPLNEVSRATYVQNGTAQLYLRNAEMKAEAEQYADAVGDLSAALAAVHSAFRPRQPDPATFQVPTPTPDMPQNVRDMLPLAEVVASLAQTQGAMRAQLDELALAPDPGEHAWFRSLAPAVEYEWTEHGEAMRPPDVRRAVSRADYHRAYNYALTVIRRIERGLADPLGGHGVVTVTGTWAVGGGDG